MNKLSIRDLDMKGKRVFIRVDFNVPLDGGKVGDDTRIRETLPTLHLAIDRGARLVLASHLGRPKGKVDPKYTSRPWLRVCRNCSAKTRGVRGRLRRARSRSKKQSRCAMAKCCCSKMCASIPRKKPTIRNFRSKLAALCDGLFVCDAFGSAHRAHASVVGITKFVRQSAAGLLMEKELAYLGKAISNPDRPFVAVLGGAKVSDKIEVVQNLMKLADAMLIGGAMAYTFLKSQGLPIGKSLVENDKLDLARELAGRSERSANSALLLPVDHVLAESPDSTATKITDIAQTPDGWMGLDIGPKTIELFSDEIAKRAHDRVERPARHVREAGVRARHAGDRARGAAASTQGRHVNRRRRRFRRGSGTSRRRIANFAHFNGRRRFARISRRRKASRRRSAHQQIMNK